MHTDGQTDTDRMLGFNSLYAVLAKRLKGVTVHMCFERGRIKNDVFMVHFGIPIFYFGLYKFHFSFSVY
jgi:hypothetical protein